MVKNEKRLEWEAPARGEKTRPVGGMSAPKFSGVKRFVKVTLYAALPLHSCPAATWNSTRVTKKANA